MSGRRMMTRARAVEGCLSVLAALLFCAPALLQAETVGGFAGRLDEAIRQVEAARDQGIPLGDPDGLLPEREEVAGPWGMVRADHSSLRGEWKSVPASGEARRESLERLRQRLVAVRAEVGEAASGAVTLPAAGWQEKLTEVLSRPEFRREHIEEDWRVRLLEWLREKLGFLFPKRATDVAFGLLGWILYALAGLALLVVMIVLVQTALPLFRRGRPPRAADAPRGPAETPDTLLALADVRTRGGDLRGAAQAIFRWMLLVLHRTGRLEYDPALTNREHLSRLSADPGVRLAFDRLCRQFEGVWYGFHPVAPEEFAAFRAECLRVGGGRA